MKEEDLITINEEELKWVVKEDFLTITNLAKSNFFCLKCDEHERREMINMEIYLDELNNVVFKGNCSFCGQAVARVVEIGEQQKYYLRVQQIKNKRKT